MRATGVKIAGMIGDRLGTGGRPHYGWDAPGVTIGMAASGAAALVLGTVLWTWSPFAYANAIGAVLAALGAILLLMCLASVRYVTSGKLRTRDAILDLVAWRGDEAVLDVGTGAGLLMIGAAKRLTKGGRAIGIDIWSAKDLSNNSPETTRRNIAIEGVSDRAEVRTENATRLPFPDASFDVVLSLLCLHNIEPDSDQAVACREIARVLKPGGRVVIGDYVRTHRYAVPLRDAGLEILRSSFGFSVLAVPMWLLVADKPAAQARS